MRISIHIEEDLLEEVLELTGVGTKAGAIRRALAEYVRQRKKQQLLALRGKLDLSLPGDESPGYKGSAP